MSYNGYKNYETWNVVLWISNDEGLYNLADHCSDYGEFVDAMYSSACTGGGAALQTPDNVAWDDSRLDIDAINEACFADEEVDEYA